MKIDEVIREFNNFLLGYKEIIDNEACVYKYEYDMRNFLKEKLKQAHIDGQKQMAEKIKAQIDYKTGELNK